MTNVVDFVLSGTYVPPHVMFAQTLTIPTPVGVIGKDTLTGTVSGNTNDTAELADCGAPHCCEAVGS